MAEGRIVRRHMHVDEVGWCHQCGTLQLFRDAPWLSCRWLYDDDEPVPCCVECGVDEPWELGVFAMPAALASCAADRHVTWGPPVCDQCGVGRDRESELVSELVHQQELDDQEQELDATA